ncbi:MAG: endonuclease-8 [Verrucomicrobiales bacterium]|jgi:endonuclease-8
MPEGHTIHRLARDLNSTLRPGRIHATSPQGRFGAEASILDAQPLRRAEAWGKHLFLDFDNAPLLHIHLGLIGKLRPKPAGQPEEGEIRLRLEGDETLWDLTGPMICALIDDDDAAAITAKLGPDPLRKDGKADEFYERMRRKKLPLAAALLDQKVIAGIGNVYRSEFCYLTGIDPHTAANSLDDEQLAALWKTSTDQLKLGLKLNRIVTREPSEVGVSAAKIGDDERLYVYKREGQPCHRCGDEIRLVEIAKRKAWHCPTCQG